MAVRGHQIIANDEACAGNACPNFRRMISEAYMIDAKKVTDRIAVVVEHEGGHGLLLPELFDLRSQFVDLGLQIVARCLPGSHWGIVTMAIAPRSQNSDDHLPGCRLP